MKKILLDAYCAADDFTYYQVEVDQEKILEAIKSGLAICDKCDKTVPGFYGIMMRIDEVELIKDGNRDDRIPQHKDDILAILMITIDPTGYYLQVTGKMDSVEAQILLLEDGSIKCCEEDKNES